MEKAFFENSSGNLRSPRKKAPAMSRYPRQDLLDILDFIAKDNRAAARKVLAKIRAACRMLAKRPQVGHLRTDLAPEPLRFWLN